MPHLAGEIQGNHGRTTAAFLPGKLSLLQFCVSMNTLNDPHLQMLCTLLEREVAASS